MERTDGRTTNQIRPTTIETNYIKHPEGSVLISVGDTKVICSASIEERVPPFFADKAKAGLQQNIACCLVLPNNETFVNLQKAK